MGKARCRWGCWELVRGDKVMQAQPDWQGQRGAGGWGKMAWVGTALLPRPSPSTVGDLADDELQCQAPSAGTEDVYIQQDAHD